MTKNLSTMFAHKSMRVSLKRRKPLLSQDLLDCAKGRGLGRLKCLDLRSPTHYGGEALPVTGASFVSISLPTLNAVLEDFYRNGETIIRNVLSREECERIVKRVAQRPLRVLGKHP